MTTINRTRRVALLGALIAASVGAWSPAASAACPWQQEDPTDQIGASRTQTPEKALEAIRLVRNGKVYGLAHPYDVDTIPLPFGRTLEVTTDLFDLDPTSPSQSFNIGFVASQIGQVGTQFDALGHAGTDLGYYNCLSPDEVNPASSDRLEKLGVETVRPFFTRGILLDFVHHSAVPKVDIGEHQIVEDSYLITLDDVLAVLEEQGVDQPGEGDVVLFHTGWDRLYGIDNDRLVDSPGPGIEVAS